MKIDISKISVGDIIAAYAALVSTILGIREILKSKMKFDVSYHENSEPGADDIITIYNGSSKSVTISSCELFRSKYGLFYGFKHKPVSLGNEADFILFTILPHEAKKYISRSNISLP